MAGNQLRDATAALRFAVEFAQIDIEGMPERSVAVIGRRVQAFIARGGLEMDRVSSP